MYIRITTLTTILPAFINIFICTFISSSLLCMQHMPKIVVKKVQTSFKNNNIPKQQLKHQHRSLFHWTEFKGLENAFRCDWLQEKASPLRGIGLIESDVLRNLYIYGPEKSAVVQLVRNKKYGLFYVILDDFRHTQINPACCLTPELTAHIVAASLQGTLELPEIKNQILAQWYDNYQKARRGKKLSKKTLKDQLDAIIRVNHEVVENENKKLFPEYFGNSLLLAHLYQKGTKQDVLQYLSTLANYFPEKIDIQAITSASLQNYSTEELEEHARHLYMQNYRAFYKNHEKAVATFMHTSHKTDAYPPHVPEGLYGYESQESRPNCCEKCIRDLCNLILSSNTDDFAVSVLPDTIKPLKQFIEFYTQFSKHQDIYSKESGQAWMNLVSGHVSLDFPRQVRYILGNYELYPSLDTILAVMNVLLQTNANSFEELSDIVSSNQRFIKLEPRENNLHITVGSLHMIIEISPGDHAITKKLECVTYETSNLIHELPYTSKSFAAHMLPLLLKVSKDCCIELNNPELLILQTYSQRLANMNKLLYLIATACSHYQKNPALQPFIVELCKKVPHNDIRLITSLFYNVLRTDLFLKEPWFADFAQHHAKAFIQSILRLCNPCTYTLYSKHIDRIDAHLFKKTIYTYFENEHKNSDIVASDVMYDLSALAKAYPPAQQILEALPERFANKK